MSQPPPGPYMPPAGPTTPTSPPYPYPYYPGYPPPQPPRRDDHTVLIVVVVIVVVLSVVAGVALYFVSQMFQNVTNRPLVTFGSVIQPNGNASFGVASVTGASVPNNFRIRLMVGTSSGIDQPLAASGVAATESVNGVTYRITWTDADGSGSVTIGDRFQVTGNGVALPAGQSFVFYLDWAGSGIVTGFSGAASWST